MTDNNCSCCYTDMASCLIFLGYVKIMFYKELITKFVINYSLISPSLNDFYSNLLMKYFSIIITCFFIFSCQQKTSSEYDENLVNEYKSDDYGMKKYVMAFLKRGPNRELTNDEANALQTAHLNNINKMAEEGKLVLAGPFFGDGEIRGIYIFNVESIQEAEALTNTDPAIRAGSLTMELKEWYGSAALMAIPNLHKKLEKRNVAEGGK